MTDNTDETADLDWIALSGKRAKGRRPKYFEDPAIDRTLSMVMALLNEVSVLRERQDTLERLLEQHGVLPREEIESYVPDREAGAERGEATMAQISRVMRPMQQELEAMKKPDRAVAEWAEDLGNS